MGDENACSSLSQPAFGEQYVTTGSQRTDIQCLNAFSSRCHRIRECENFTTENVQDAVTENACSLRIESQRQHRGRRLWMCLQIHRLGCGERVDIGLHRCSDTTEGHTERCEAIGEGDLQFSDT